jgi:hypothetical protein
VITFFLFFLYQIVEKISPLSFKPVVINNMAGQIVGVIFFYGTPATESSKLLNVMFTSQPSARLLVEAEGSHVEFFPEVLLVRQTLAWLTGIILLISTLLGVRLDIK